MQVHIIVQPFEHAVFMPFGLANSEPVAVRFQCRDVISFFPGIGDYENDIDNWFGGETGDCGRSYMLHAQGKWTEGSADFASLIAKPAPPRQIVLNQQNWLGQGREFAHAVGRRYSSLRRRCSPP
jgi:hypothetical protein